MNPFSDTLRTVADFFDDHPELEHPGSYQSFHVFVSKKDLPRIARILGTFEKRVCDNWFFLIKRIGSAEIHFNCSRKESCTQVVVGKKTIKVPKVVVEEEKVVDDIQWVCPDSVFSLETEGAAK